MIIESEHLRLRAPIEDDVEKLVKMASKEVLRHLPLFPDPLTPQFAAAVLDGMAQSHNTNIATQFVIAARETNELIGGIILKDVETPSLKEGVPQRRMELSYALRQEDWNKGWTSEAVKSVVAYAFGSPLNLDSVSAIVEPDNIASIRVLEKTGFVFIDDSPRPERGWLRGGTEVKNFLLENFAHTPKFA